MEKTENKYQRGKIYKIISNQTNDVYYGSSVEPYLTNRLSRHKSNYKGWLNDKDYYMTSFEIIKFDDAKIILVENYQCNTKDELRSREQYYIDNFDCVNKHKAFIGSNKEEYRKKYFKEYNEKNKIKRKAYRDQNKIKYTENHKKYYELNKEKLSEYHKEYVQQNKDKISEHNKEYRKQNKDKIAEYKQQHYEKNKVKLLESKKEKINCVCGSVITVGVKAKHQRTKKHQEFIENQKLIHFSESQ